MVLISFTIAIEQSLRFLLNIRFTESEKLIELWSEKGSPMDRSVIESGEVVRTRSKIFNSLVVLLPIGSKSYLEQYP